jgi:hypothetical protein
MEITDKKLDKKGANKKRSKILTKLKFENMRLAAKIETHLKNNLVEPENKELAYKLIASLYKCSTHTLYGYTGDQIQLISPVTCNHKICNICNWMRQKKIRRKYFKWFETNEEIVELENRKTGTKKYVTLTRYNNKFKNTLNFKFIDYRKYDLMHLTLTVPHTKENGWKYKQFYFDEIKTAFNFMRKTEEWNELVYGGEYGVEATRNDEGFHIHIHALLFVRIDLQNRNNLHKTILKIWNRLTAWEGSSRKEFTEYQISQIIKGNSSLDKEFVRNLDPTGATLIGLETIYTKDPETGQKVRSFEFNSEAMIKAVMETISYHFKPQMFKITEDYIDIETIIEILPVVYRQILYFKFGCLHGESCLNVKDDTLLEDYDEMEFDEDTGEIFERHFFITSPDSMYHDQEGNIRVKKTKERCINKIDAQSGKEAVNKLIEISTNKYIAKA